MAATHALRRLDDRVLHAGRTSEGLKQFGNAVLRVSSLVLYGFAAALLLAVLLVALPVNESNAVVSADLFLADRAAGPLRDVFAFDSRPVRAAANYGLAAAAYLLVGRLVSALRR